VALSPPSAAAKQAWASYSYSCAAHSIWLWFVAVCLVIWRWLLKAVDGNL